MFGVLCLQLVWCFFVLCFNISLGTLQCLIFSVCRSNLENVKLAEMDLQSYIPSQRPTWLPGPGAHRVSLIQHATRTLMLLQIAQLDSIEEMHEYDWIPLGLILLLYIVYSYWIIIVLYLAHSHKPAVLWEVQVILQAWNLASSVLFYHPRGHQSGS